MSNDHAGGWTAALPQFTHDCDACRFLGRFRIDDKSWAPADYDLYYCSPSLGGCSFATVIARYGNGGSEYTSGMAIADMGIDPRLLEAKRRAVEQGLTL